MLYFFNIFYYLNLNFYLNFVKFSIKKSKFQIVNTNFALV